MSIFDDSPHEMHDDSLTPDTAERLLDGENLSPEFADLAAMVDDVRNMASSTPTPAVRGALAEYVGVGLIAVETPADLPATAAVSQHLDLTVADQPRRRSVFAEVLTFAGTVSGKLLIGGAVAAASVTGAQASGLVDLPGFPDKPETVIVADDIDEEPNELPLEDKADEKTDEVSDEAAEDKAGEEKPEPVETDEFPGVDDAAEIKDATDKAEEAAAEKAEAEREAAEKEAAEKEAAEKEAAEKAEEEKKEDKPKEEPSENEAAIDALEAQLILDKQAVYAAATALITPLEADKKVLVEALEATLGTLEQARNEAKAPLYAELETTEDSDRRVEIEAEIDAIFEQWELDRDAAIAEASPAITAIELQLETIEIDRDAEITALLEAFHAAVDALESGK